MDLDARIRAINSLYRYYAHAEVMRFEYHRYSLMPERPVSQSGEMPFPAPPDPKEHGVGAFSEHWFAALHVVIEGWQLLGLPDEDIQSRLESPYLDQLRRFRNAVYHFQPLGLNDPRSVPFSTDLQLVLWAMSLSDAFRAFFSRSNDRNSAVAQWLRRDFDA